MCKIIVLLICLFPLQFVAQDEYFDEDYLRYENYIYSDSIYTVQLYREGWPLSYPVIELNSDEHLIFSFDEFSSDINDYSYTIIHCTHDWQPSDLQQQEYIDGFTEAHNIDYKYSFNTLKNYIHYSLVFPNDDIKPKKSGNYILLVFKDFDRENPVITRRFYIVENKVDVEAKIGKPFQFDYAQTHQEFDFTVNTAGLQVNDPIEEIKVYVSQNFRPDNMISNLKPLFIKDNLLDYNYDEENIFLAGNEFRNFDIKSMRYQSEYIKDVQLLGNDYHVQLTDDYARTFGAHFTEADINGRRLIYKQEAENSDVEADYALVYFNLPYESPFINGNLYVFGELSDYKFTEQNRMVYNFEKKCYQLCMFLKQGYYNYQYVYLEDGKKEGDHGLIEGSHYDTENDYIVFVYHKDYRARYDKLVGVSIFNSMRQGGIEIDGPFKNFNLKIDKLFRK